jgi:hypothetical protein
LAPADGATLQLFIEAALDRLEDTSSGVFACSTLRSACLSRESFWSLGLHRLTGTVRYPEAA